MSPRSARPGTSTSRSPTSIATASRAVARAARPGSGDWAGSHTQRAAARDSAPSWRTTSASNSPPRSARSSRRTRPTKGGGRRRKRMREENVVPKMILNELGVLKVFLKNCLLKVPSGKVLRAGVCLFKVRARRCKVRARTTKGLENKSRKAMRPWTVCRSGLNRPVC